MRRFLDGAKADDTSGNFRALVFALLALASGHMLSTLLRTIPAISLDVMAADHFNALQRGEPAADSQFFNHLIANCNTRPASGCKLYA